MAARDTSPPPKLRKLSVIVPVFNERNTLVEILRRMRAVELPDGIEREIIVVDDGSDDGTRDVLRQLGDSTVRVVMHDSNRGKGAAVRTGFAARDRRLRARSRTPTSSTTPRTGRSCSRRCCAGKARVVYGSRFTGERRNMLFLHWVGNRFLSLDHERALQHDALRHGDVLQARSTARCSIELELQSNRFDIEPEITAKILKRGVRIYEVPISYTGREFDEGKKITWRDGFAALWTLVKYRFGD